MTSETRTAAEIAVWAFAAVALATSSLYVLAFRSAPISTAAIVSVAIGSVAAASGFFAAFTLLRRRSRSMNTLLGTRRGAGLGVLVLMVAALTHALHTSGSAGAVYSIFGQMGYALLVFGVPFAIAGSVLGHSLDRRLLSSPTTANYTQGPSGDA